MVRDGPKGFVVSVGILILTTSVNHQVIGHQSTMWQSSRSRLFVNNAPAHKAEVR